MLGRGVSHVYAAKHIRRPSHLACTFEHIVHASRTASTATRSSCAY